MKIEQQHKDHISAAFQKLDSKEDLLILLNYAKALIYGKKTIPFELKQLNYYSNPKVSSNRYKKFEIRKKSGATRTIHAPVKGLKSLQKALNLMLHCVFEPHTAATGFVMGKSIVDNAKLHLESYYVYNIDLKDFFHGIDQARVWKCLQNKPLNLGSKRQLGAKKSADFYSLLGVDPIQFEKSRKYEVVNVISALCCTEMIVERLNDAGELVEVVRNVLPQGAPTSPIITNIVCQRLDYLLSAVAKRFGLRYSRYADDITFSSLHNVYQKDGDFIKELNRIIAEQGFQIKESKTRLQKEGYRQEVTGLLVNDKVNVQQRYIKQLRMWLYYWERYGYEKAEILFLSQYTADKGHTKKGMPNMLNVITGKLDYLKMVKGGESEAYLKLTQRFILLTATLNSSPILIADEITDTTFDFNQVKITLEVYKSSKLNGKLNNSIRIPKDTILPNTLIVDNTKGEIPDDDNQKLFPHNPLYTVSFLKKFKIGDGSGFKELVHDVILTDEKVDEIIYKVKSYPNFIYHFKKEWVSGVSYLNKGIQREVIALINLFEKEGIPFYRNTHKHPYNNDNIYTDFTQVFKKKYRYGSGSEYSKLQFDIIEIFKDQKLSDCCLRFLPDERKFNIRSSFFTWQPSVYNGIRYIIQGIFDHSNINGEIAVNKAQKKILIEAEKVLSTDDRYIEIRILDCQSLAKIDSEMLLHYLKESEAYKNDFRNLCDWIVECDFLEESSKKLNILIKPNESEGLQEIETLPGLVGGFKHILRFYDVR